MSEYLKQQHAYADIWFVDLIEWELGGRPADVAISITADATLRTLLADPDAGTVLLMHAPTALVEAARSSGASLARARSSSAPAWTESPSSVARTPLASWWEE